INRIADRIEAAEFSPFDFRQKRNQKWRKLHQRTRKPEDLRPPPREDREAWTTWVPRLIMRSRRREAKRVDNLQDAVFGHPIVAILQATAEFGIAPRVEIAALVEFDRLVAEGPSFDSAGKRNTARVVVLHRLGVKIMGPNIKTVGVAA